MERSALQLAAAGKTGRATALLDSEKYAQAAQRYQKAVASASELSEKDSEDELQSATRLRIPSLVVAVMAIALNVAFVIVATLVIRKWGVRLRALAKELEDLASHDPLSGLASRKLFTVDFAAALARARRSGEHVGVLMVDVNGFEAINDSHGHLVGDAVLREVAARLMRTMREVDVVARIGGDELAVILEGLPDIQTLSVIADRVSDELTFRYADGQHDVRVSAAVGTALADPSDLEGLDRVLSSADRSMYKQKTSMSESESGLRRDAP